MKVRRIILKNKYKFSRTKKVLLNEAIVSGYLSLFYYQIERRYRLNICLSGDKRSLRALVLIFIFLIVVHSRICIDLYGVNRRGNSEVY